MALQVAKRREDKVWHLVKKKFWGPASSEYLQTFMMQFHCEEEPRNRTPGKWKSQHYAIVPYEKDVHRKKVCPSCVVKIKVYNGERKES